ncbi:MAG TPA: bifunctional alpha,alpha-trehalose-phosphate synthase (UDP-forming)/trehalose-phosphatase [Flavisolibacter sp.]|jgi:trehalose 6-phosphate synthase/phosphatase|nr:bifunctional alpha,alpha-trehalose-phosphate synthase (UDP-forming)/trehalose-phosphatase [Flavisolibacter sp.]
MKKNSRLFIVSNRLPVTVRQGQSGDVEIKTSSGGLITAMDSFLQADNSGYSETYWVGVPGCNPSAWEEASRKLDASLYTYLPVLLYKEQYENYYNGFSNSVVWPLFHYFPSFAEYRPEYYEHYLLANEHFLEVILRYARPGDTVWIHDYHLMPLARLLRNRIPDITIGFFLHIPFPSYEIFRMLPRKWQEGILQGLLGADLVGFHTMDYAAHFLQSVQLVLGLDNDRHIIRYDNRLVKVDVFPISIDYQKFNTAYQQDGVVSLRDSLQNKLLGQKIIFSVDRLDYTKGVQNRLRAYELFLDENPEYRGKVVFIMVIVPSRDTITKYAERKRIIDELVSGINGRVGGVHWQPIIYRYNTLSFDEMVALYSACNLALITPLRDGMNLVSKEFVASRQDKKGVLVLSEMAGAARELTDAICINPNDIIELSGAIKDALEMPLDEQQKRMDAMQRRVAHYDVQTWAQDFIGEMQQIKQKQESFQIFFLDVHSKRNLLDAYRKAKKRLLLLDYDGTLVPFAPQPQQALPGRGLVQLIESLSANAANDVYVISGRSSAWLQTYFGHLPVSLVAEHGARTKEKEGEWTTAVQTHSEWKESITQVMEMYVRRCPGSSIEEKEFSIVWHYRNANPEQGKLRALELMGELNDFIHTRRLQVMAGNKIVEVRNSGIDKGTAIKKILAQKTYDFIFAAGDDRTDEDMFKVLSSKQNCFSIKVGTEASFARFNLQTPQMVISLLESLNHLQLASVH